MVRTDRSALTAATALVHDPAPRPGAGDWLLLRRPREVVVARDRDAVRPGFARVADAARQGAWACGFVTYEAAAAFAPELVTHDRDALPYAWWAVFDEAERVDLEPAITTAAAPAPLAWHPLVATAAHRAGIEAIKQAIARGDTYQVNYTFPLEAPFDDAPLDFFLALMRAQRPPYGCYLDLGRFQLLSASPELFFARRGSRLVTRPMKGTARRGRFPEEDRAAWDALRASEKERAENVMIVDMMRNDLGRVARAGSVRVPHLFTVETYPTLHQLTSTVEAESDTDLAAVLAALFPCASITGAPKVSTMGIIRDLEPHPRGVYTGTIGLLRPGGDARFSVAIRTVTVDRARQRARYGTGGGIVWDSDAAREHDECRTKALILTTSRPPFGLLETLLWRPGTGFRLLDRHLARLAASAAYFGQPLDPARIRAALDRARARWDDQPRRVRLTVDRSGRPEVTAVPFPTVPRRPWTVCLDDRTVDDRDPFLFHKTTRRAVYDDARARHPTVDDVLLRNARGEITEATRANLVVRMGDRLITPALACGLLPGVFRGALLARGRIHEGIVREADLSAADEVFLVNALRGILRVRACSC